MSSRVDYFESGFPTVQNIEDSNLLHKEDVIFVTENS